MLNSTLSYSLVIVSISLALISLVTALGRRERALWIYAAGFDAAAVSFVLFPGQGRVSPWICVILANIFIFIFHLFLAWGIRTFYAHARPWPVRFWFYVSAFPVLLIIFTFVHADYRVRAVIVSAFIVVLTVEFAGILFPGFIDMPKEIRHSVKAFVLSVAAFHLCRIAILLLNIFPGHFFMDSSPITTVTLSFTIFSGILWGGFLMMLDGARLMNDMNKKNELLKNMAMKDELTGVFNRHFLDQTILSEMERQDRYKAPLSLVMLDLDHFKNVNDLYGHDAGDCVLTEAARRVRDAIRETDLLFRWGGEEFLVLMPHTDLSGAVTLAEKLRQSISGKPVSPVGTVTGSFGVAERIPGESRIEWFRRVDSAVYRAKEKGRNKVEVWTGEMSVSSATVRIEWQKDWESGMPEIDDEHRAIVRMGNELLNLSLSGSSADRGRELMDILFDHIRQHFADEELILERVGYPEKERHSGIHRELYADALSLQEKFARGEVDSQSLFHFLVDKVVIGHMLTEDVRFFPYTRRRQSYSASAD